MRPGSPDRFCHACVPLRATTVLCGKRMRSEQPMNAACVAPQELNRLLDERPLPEGQYAAWRNELKEQEAQFPLAFPLRDDVIVPQWAIKVRPPPAPLPRAANSPCAVPPPAMASLR